MGLPAQSLRSLTRGGAYQNRHRVLGSLRLYEATRIVPTRPPCCFFSVATTVSADRDRQSRWRQASPPSSRSGGCPALSGPRDGIGSPEPANFCWFRVFAKAAAGLEISISATRKATGTVEIGRGRP